IDEGRTTLAGMGLLLMVIGNYLPRIRSNWWMGIRTPWTLESERVWRDTHRVGGRTFVAGGLLCAIAAFLPEPFSTFVPSAALALGALIPVVYSYVAYRRETREHAG
ncbi:MAG: SdpI family protein, partial [Gemmatimonadetes bacterium]|nr:SdpI family protein [Gemmatimonadota bacterium]